MSLYDDSVKNLLDDLDTLQHFQSKEEYDDVLYKRKFVSRLMACMEKEGLDMTNQHLYLKRVLNKEPIYAIDENSGGKGGGCGGKGGVGMKMGTRKKFSGDGYTECFAKLGRIVIDECNSENGRGKRARKIKNFDFESLNDECIAIGRKRKGKEIAEDNDEYMNRRGKKRKTDKKSRKKAIGRRKIDTGQIIRELPEHYIEKIGELGGKNVTLLAQKRLSTTDVNDGQNRLTFSEDGLLNQEFLNEVEKAQLRRDEKVEGRLLVPSTMNGGCSEVIKVNKWHVSGNYYYVLLSPWKDAVVDNGFKADDVVQVWCFRFDEGKLGIAVVKIFDAGAECSHTGDGSGGSTGGGSTGGCSDGGSTGDSGGSSGVTVVCSS